MNEECALLHLMAMGVPARLAGFAAQWLVSEDHVRNSLCWNPEAQHILMSCGVHEESHYAMYSDEAVMENRGLVVVHSPRTGFNTAFRHPENSNAHAR